MSLLSEGHSGKPVASCCCRLVAIASAAMAWSHAHSPLSAPTGKRSGRDAGPSTALQISRPSDETFSPFLLHHRDLDRDRCRCCQGVRAPPSEKGARAPQGSV